MTPPAQHQHDCDDCVFLGTYGDADLYICFVRTLMPEGTLLVRHSSEPSDYWSMWPVAVMQHEALVAGSAPAFVEALRRAQVRQLIP